MKIDIWFGVVLALLLSVMPTTPALAQAQYPVRPPNGGVHSLLVNAGDHRLHCLQPKQAAPINGLAIVHQPCNRYDLDLYQRWRFLWMGRGRQDNSKPWIYLVINSGSGQCLDDRDGKTADGSPVQQWTCNTTSTTMQWKLVVVGNIKYYTAPVSYAQFINMRSGKCLDIRGGSYAPGTALQIYRCTSTGTPGSGRENLAQVFGWVDTMELPIPPP